MIEPFFFNNNKLFGCYHPAEGYDSRRLLIICPPLFDDFRRSYRSLYDLANACADGGVHVLRFDYFGTGESMGLLDQTSTDEWINNVNSAITEGLALSGAEEILLMGVRFGATLAAQTKHESVKCYIFWDPVMDGSEYLGWLEKVNQSIYRDHKYSARDLNIIFEDIEYSNFDLTPSLKEGISQLRIQPEQLIDNAETYLLTTDPENIDTSRFTSYDFTGLRYNWPPYHDGLITQKPALEAIARRVVAK